LEASLSPVLLDTHVLHWWSAQPERLSEAASQALTQTDELSVSAITWYELGWLARHERIRLAIPIRSWLEGLAAYVRTVGITPAIADIAVSLPSSFPGDPADRLIYATAVEQGWRLVTGDERLRAHPYPRPVALW
jgi:PIN domain nuclease of toxin-antitoxin system